LASKLLFGAHERKSTGWQATGEDLSRQATLDIRMEPTRRAATMRQKKLVERGNYLRIWKKQNGVWKVVLDVANPLPPE